MGQNKAMKIYYEEPKLTLSSLELEGFLCGSGEPKCLIFPLDAQVNDFEDVGTANGFESGDIILK